MKLEYPISLTEAGHQITQLFGAHANPYPGYLGHMGIDFAAPLGTPDHATHDSKIVEVVQNSTGYGFDVIEEFDEAGFTWQVIHGHHQKNEVTVGQMVKQGDEIGRIGSTGYSTGPHVHIGLRQYKNGQLLNEANGYHGWIDPMPYFKGVNMGQFKTQNYKGELRIVLETATPEEWAALCSVYGVDQTKPVDETV